MRSKTIPFSWITVYANDDTTSVFLPIGPWMQATDVSGLQVPFELQGRAGNITVQAAYQTADDIRSPDTAQGIGSVQSANGYQDPTAITDVSNVFNGKRQFRMGLICINSSGSIVSLARAQGSVILIPRS